MAETLAGDGITDLHSQEHMHWQNTFDATSSDPFLYHVNRWTNWYNNSHAIVLHQSRPPVKPQPPTVVTQAFGNLMPYKIVRELGNADLVVRQKALLWAVEYLSVAENRARCFAAGLLPTLMKHFQEDDLHMQQHLALAFKHAAGSQDGCRQMSQLGAVKGLVNMLSSPDKVVRGNAFAALNAALSSEVVRTELTTGGTTLQFILDRINNDTEEDCFKFGLKVLFKSLRGGLDQEAIGQLLKADAIKTCVRLISHIDAEVKESAAQLLCLLALTIEGRAISVEQQVVADLLQLLQDLEPLVQAAAAAALMSVTIHVDSKKQLISEGGVLPVQELIIPRDEILCLNILQVVTNMGEHPTSRKDLQEAKAVIHNILEIPSSSAILRRCAKTALQQLLFKHLPFHPLPSNWQ